MSVQSTSARAAVALFLLWSNPPARAETPLLLIPGGATWKYVADGSLPSVHWKAPNFPDNSWASGPAPLGYGRGDEATVIHTGSPSGPVTTYFRHTLLLTNTTPFRTVTLRLRRDDGAVVYVNGDEVFRSNLPLGTLLASSTALLPIDGDDEQATHQQGVWPYYFEAGTNVIAVELHQHSAGLGDARFDLELLANLPITYPSVVMVSPADAATFAAGPIRLRATASDLEGHVILLQYLANGQLLGSSTNPPFDYLWMDPEPGRYVIRARATDNSGRSSDSPGVHVQVGAVEQSLLLLRGPYLQNATPTSVTIRWRTDWFADSLVAFDTNPELLDQEVWDGQPVVEHEVRLTNLLPDTRYYYSIGSRGGVLSAGSDHTFTSPPTGAKPTRIWAIGDSGTANANAAAVREAYLDLAAGREPDVWLMLGDNAYESGTDEEYQAAVFDMYPELLRRTFLWPTLGNHDASSAGYPGEFPYFDIFTLPRQGEAGGVASGTERYYSFDYGNIHFVCLDAMSSDRRTGGPMLKWLEQDLADTTRDWIIAYWHHPPYTWGTHNSDRELELIEMREHALPLLEAHGVDLVLCGHSHVYERSWLLNGHYGDSTTFAPHMQVRSGLGREGLDHPYHKPAGGLGANQGAVYIVCGCSGEGGFFNFPRHPAMAVNLAGHGSVVIDIDGLRMDVRFLNTSRQIQDYFAIRKDLPADEPPPRLSVQRVGEQLNLAWPTSLLPYELQSAPASSWPPQWSSAPLPTNVVGRQFRAIAPIDQSNRVFRLRAVAW